jgi:hypothetical protein
LLALVAPAKDVLPWPHGVHAAAPAVAEYVPAGQIRHVEGSVAPTIAEYLPTTHFVHAVEDVAPRVLECVPAGQEEQVSCPAGEKVPAIH